MSEAALDTARALAAGIDPHRTADRCGVTYDESPLGGGRFGVSFLGEMVTISYPAFDFAPECALPPHVRALLVRYLGGCDGSQPAGDWCSFAELPEGRFYVQAFQGYTGNALVRRLSERPGDLARAAIRLDGTAAGSKHLATNADAAWVFSALPCVPVALVWWNADEEFPARAELLFDRTASQHLPTDGCAVLGSWLTTRLIGEAEKG